jgi:hypothetical protein
MKNKNNFIILMIAVVAVVVASVSTVVAYIFKKSQVVENQFVPAAVQCAVKETFKDDTKSSVKVENTGNIEAYIRLRVVTYWQDSKGNVVGLTAPEIKFGDTWKYDTEKWIYDADEKTFYHKAPVAAEALTSELFEDGFSGIKLEKKTVTFDGQDYIYHPVITFMAEAIQSVPSNAVAETWKVTLDGNGNITALN